MSLFSQIESDLVTAMKEHNEARTAVLRLLKNALKNEEIKLRRELTPEESLKILQRESKQRRDSITAYEQGGRVDLADEEKAELVVISSYLPTLMSEEELNTIIAQVVNETGAQSMNQMGEVIGKVMAITAGKAEGGTVSRLVKQKLG